MRASEGAVAGIDVGCSPTRRSSAICLLSWTSKTVSWQIDRFRAIEPEREAAIAGMVAGQALIAAAFDGPLRRGLEIIGRYRSAERMLTRRLQPLIGKPGQSSTPVGRLLNRHANACVAHVLAHSVVGRAVHPCAIDERAVVEAFPSSFLGLMIDTPADLAARRADRSDTFFHHLAATGDLTALVARLLPGRRLASDPMDLVNHDDRAAFVCALTALGVAMENYVAVGDDVDGWIVLPPRDCIRSPQWALLRLNASEDVVGRMVISEGNGAA